MRKTAIKIRVKHSGLIELKSFDDFPDGSLTVAEVGEHVPFKIKRLYVINNLFNNRAVRGRHAHKKTIQYIFCLNGQFTLALDDGKTKQKIILDRPEIGVLLGEMLWHEMSKFSKDCLILVIASDFYKESDYIRDYKEFKRLVSKQ
jgi:dTDP-4-dehydrorhamnose 3,5-epimerase-like enzyme